MNGASGPKGSSHATQATLPENYFSEFNEADGEIPEDTFLCEVPKQSEPSGDDLMSAQSISE